MAPPPEGRVPWMARVTNSPGAQNCLEQFWTARARVRRTEAGKPQQIWTHFSAARRASAKDGAGNPSQPTPKAWALFIELVLTFYDI